MLAMQIFYVEFNDFDILINWYSDYFLLSMQMLFFYILDAQKLVKIDYTIFLQKIKVVSII